MAPVGSHSSTKKQQAKGKNMPVKGLIKIAIAFMLLLTLMGISHAQQGVASVYSGERTANGEWANAARLTAAHKTLPFGTLVKVTHRRTGKSVVVRINDRGPYVRGRVIDLTPAAAQAIGSDGLAHVELSVVGDDSDI
jgi:rare lipoprotein A